MKPKNSKKKYRVMKEFRIDEISAVDKPAQVGATMVLMKRDDGAIEKIKPRKGESKEDYMTRFMSDKGMNSEYEDEDQRAAVASSMWREKDKKVKKQVRMLSDVNGHTHIIDDTSMDCHTSYEKAPDDEYGHSHPWVRAMDGKVIIGMADGHTHEITEKRATLLEDGTLQHEDPAAKAAGEHLNEEPTMTEEEKAALAAANKRAADAEASLAVSKAFGSLNDAERAHYNSLDEAGKAGFLAKSTSERQGILAKLAGENPVVYTGADGSEFRKNDDPRLVKMARERDEDRKQAREASDKLAESTLTKRAETELNHLPGTVPAKVALLKAVDGIADEKVRTEATALLKAGNDAMTKAFERAGSSNAPAGGSTDEQLEVLAQKHATDHKVGIMKARVAVLDTPEGKALYEKRQPAVARS